MWSGGGCGKRKTEQIMQGCGNWNLTGPSILFRANNLGKFRGLPFANLVRHNDIGSALKFTRTRLV